MEKMVSIPGKLNEMNVISSLEEMMQFLEEPRVLIDFSNVAYVWPFGTLILAEGIKEFVSYRKRNGLDTNLRPCERIDNEEGTPLSYLRFFHFFDYVDAPCGRDISPAAVGKGYIPITEITKQELIERAGSERKIQDAIEDLCTEIAGNLVNERNMYIENTITYCFREIIRNTFEHAQINSCTIMAQSWRRNNDFEVALVDNGVGILSTIKQQHEVRITEDALDLSLSPGTSGAAYNPSDDKWGNTGFGLYILSELGKKYGTFSIYSSGVLIQIRGDKKTYTDITIGGTGVKLCMNLDDAEYFPNIREFIIQRGEKMSSVGPGTIQKASKKSRS